MTEPLRGGRARGGQGSTSAHGGVAAGSTTDHSGGCPSDGVAEGRVCGADLFAQSAALAVRGGAGPAGEDSGLLVAALLRGRGCTTAVAFGQGICAPLLCIGGFPILSSAERCERAGPLRCFGDIDKPFIGGDLDGHLS